MPYWLKMPHMKGGKIATITEKTIQGKESLDAKGHVSLPGE